MWQGDWRDNVWNAIDQPWDLIVIGGGITGAGIFLEASRMGLRTLLVEQRDFSWGTSSRSSKLVHGGLRYLQQGHVRMIHQLLHERNRLLEDAPGLVEPLGFLLPHYKGHFPGRWGFELALSVYDLLGLKWNHKHYNSHDFGTFAPHITRANLEGGFRYFDGQTDDSRLVLRVLRDAVCEYCWAINYVSARELIRRGDKVVGVGLRDAVSGRTAEVGAKAVINATGIWGDLVRAQIGARPRLRPLRGSHLIFPHFRLPVAQALVFSHPADRRHLCLAPWEGATILGTTDVDHDRPLDDEPGISSQEFEYMMEGLRTLFPSLGIEAKDVIATFAGVRPVIGSGKTNSHKESRDYMIREENGLLSVSGGKLTNFRRIAHDTLAAARRRIHIHSDLGRQAALFRPRQLDWAAVASLNESSRRRLVGRYGSDALTLLSASGPGELESIPGTETLWAELRFASLDEGVVHLDDLLLRRTRLGLLLPKGGADVLPKIRSICQHQLAWDDARWEAEAEAYLALWHERYSLPK